MSDLNRMKREYRETPIPDELESVVRKEIRRHRAAMKRNRILRGSLVWAAAVVLVFVAVVNLSPASANAMAQLPVLRNLVRIATFTELLYDDGAKNAQVKIPEIQGLEDDDLSKALNEEYLRKNTDLYAKFVEGYGEGEWTPLALYTNFNVKASTDRIFAIESIVTEIGASAKESVHYDNIDLENQIIITLPSLFKDDGYIDVISGEIKDQMRQQMDPEKGVIYFIEGESEFGGFDEIDAEQTFYINPESQLVVVFDEYDVAPGFMGIVEFTIPTEAIQDLLVSNIYIK